MKFTRGQLATGVFAGQRIHVRWGTSYIGSDWEIVEGDIYGHVPEELLEDVQIVEDPTKGTLEVPLTPEILEDLKLWGNDGR